MKAVILAAGMGIRLRPVTDKLPKGLIAIEEKSLLERSLLNLKAYGIEDVVIVVGFQADLIRQAFGTTYHGVHLTYIVNSRYATTGSMYSLSQARHLLDHDILLLESDLLYEEKAIEVLLHSPFDDVILVSSLLHSGDDVYICVNAEQQISNLGKHIPEEDKQRAIGSLVGISKFSGAFLATLFDKAEDDYRHNRLNAHYEECVFEINKAGKPVYIEFCKDLDWIEIDNENDLKRAKETVFPQIIMSQEKEYVYITSYA